MSRIPTRIRIDRIRARRPVWLLCVLRPRSLGAWSAGERAVAWEPSHLVPCRRVRREADMGAEPDISRSPEQAGRPCKRRLPPLPQLPPPPVLAHPSAFDEADNSADEEHEPTTDARLAAMECEFARRMAAKGLEIKRMAADGNCLFRCVADRVYGDAEMHDVVRQQCMDHMERERDHYSQYITQDFGAYLARKRRLGVHGNHAEIQAMSEIYNRRALVYAYSNEPMNTFEAQPLEAQGTAMSTDDDVRAPRPRRPAQRPPPPSHLACPRNFGLAPQASLPPTPLLLLLLLLPPPHPSPPQHSTPRFTPDPTAAAQIPAPSAPLRLSYHGRNHYNLLVDPTRPDVGEGLGLPGLQPGRADEEQLRAARDLSEQARLTERPPARLTQPTGRSVAPCPLPTGPAGCAAKGGERGDAASHRRPFAPRP